MRTFFARTPLRVKLVAAVLVLVTAALTFGGVASAVAMRSYLIGRIDDQLRQTTRQVNVQALVAALNSEARSPGFVLPSDFAVGIVDVNGVGRFIVGPSDDGRRLQENDLPRLPKGVAAVEAKVDHSYTVLAVDGQPRWRVLLSWLPNGLVLVVAQKLTQVENAVDRLVTIDLLVATVSLVILAALGVALVRKSMRPLVEIEHTAAAIADGDLTRRVPDSDPRTEVGQLGRALNAMLAHIETAFAARASSEQAARDAARVAQASEARAVRSEERMRQFVADASHELRTPLTSIRGFAELYRQGAAREPEQTEALLKRIEDEAARMGLLVEDLLLLARLDEERPLNLVPVDLRVVAADAVTAARAVAPDRKITLDVVRGAHPPFVVGDEARLRQVIGNLMTNALTHTPPGTAVTLRVCVEGDHVGLEVRDNGPGLTPEQAERVFERFYRVDRARTRRAERTGAATAYAFTPHSGSGLGLAIVAALVAAHDGTVEVDSVPGEGAAFKVRLPLHVVQEEGNLSETSQPDHSSAEAISGTVEA